MNEHIGKRGAQLAVTGGLLLCLTGSVLEAGDAILFPNGAPVPPASSLALQRGDPIQFLGRSVGQPFSARSRNDSDLPDTTENAGIVGALGAPAEAGSRSPAGMDPGAASMRRNWSKGQKNWLTGEETDQRITDADFGIRDASLDSIEKQGFNESAVLGNLAKSIQSSSQTQDRNGRRESREEPNPSLAEGPAQQPALSAHQENALDMRQLFNLGGSAAEPVLDKSEFSLRDFIFGPQSSRGEDLRAPRETTSPLLESGKSGEGVSGPLGNLNSLPGWGQPAAAPLFSKPSQPALGSRAPDMSAPDRETTRLGGTPPSAPTPSGGYAPGISGYSSVPSPSFRPPEPERKLMSPTRIEPPRRKF